MSEAEFHTSRKCDVKLRAAAARFRWGTRGIVVLCASVGVISAKSMISGDGELALVAMMLVAAIVVTDRVLLRCRSCRTPLFWAALKATSAFGMDHPLQHMNPCPKCGARQ